MSTDTSNSLAEMLEHWVAADIISAEQAERIRADVATSPGTPPVRPSAPRATSLVTEAMGYLGGVIVLVGLGLVVGWYWADLSTAAHIALAGGVTALLMIAGGAVPAGLGAVGVRLRAVLWVASCSALFATLALIGADGLAWNGDAVLLLAGGGTAVVSAVLWVLHRHLPQQATVLASLLVAAAAATAVLTDPYYLPAVAVWATGAAWFVLARLDIVVPQRSGTILGSIAAIGGAASMEGEWWGTLVALATVVSLVLTAVLIRDLVLLAVASVGTLIVLPAIVVRYFPGVLSAALALLAVGLLLVAAAVFVARRRRDAKVAPHV